MCEVNALGLSAVDAPGCGDDNDETVDFLATGVRLNRFRQVSTNLRNPSVSST